MLLNRLSSSLWYVIRVGVGDEYVLRYIICYKNVANVRRNVFFGSFYYPANSVFYLKKMI